MSGMMRDRSGIRRNAQTNVPGAPGSTNFFIPYGGNGPGNRDERHTPGAGQDTSPTVVNYGS